MFKRIKSLFKMDSIRSGDYVLLAIKDGDRWWKTYDEYNALPPSERLRILNPMKPYDRESHTNCWIHRVKKPITQAFYQVTGVRDGIQVKSIQKGHPRSKPSDTIYKSVVCLYNILDLAKSRDDMIQKRSLLK